MADAPEIKVKLTAEDQGVAAAIKELGAQLKNLKQQQDETAGSSLNLAGAFKGLVAVIAVEKLLAFGKATADAAVSIARASQVTGASVQTLTVFNKAAEDIGVSSEAVDKGFVKLSRSILQFQQGNAQATLAFKALGVSAKDLAGLNTDQKILLITNRLGSMKDGMTKAALAQQLLGRGGAELIPVLNDLAGDGFENARAKAEQFGLLLDNDTTASMLAAKKSFQDLEDAGKGMATQFEAGIVPALTDISNALVKATTEEGVSGFRSFGQFVGDILKGLVLDVALLVGAILEAGAKASALVQNIGRAIGDTFTKGIKGAITNFQANELGDAARIEAEIQSRTAALYSELQGNTREQETAAAKAKAAKRSQGDEPNVGAAAPSDAAARAALALLEKQLEDELAIHRAYAAQTAEVDKQMYDAGEISLAEYFDRRRAAIKADTDEETAILQQGLVAAQAAVQKAAEAKAKAATPKDADKQEAARLQALEKVDELQTKITELQVSSSTKISALDAEQFKQQNDNNEKILAFHKLIDESQGKALDVAKQEIAIETQKLAIILRQAGESEAQVQAELAKYTALKTAAASFDDTQKQGQSALKDIADQRAAIEDRVKNGQLFQVQADAQIRDLEQSRIPQLQQIADLMVAQAKATGDVQKIQAAEDFQKQVTQLSAESDQAGQMVAKLKETLQSSLTSGFANLFTSLVSGTKSVGDAFKSLASSVLSSLSQMAAQMLAQIVITKLLKSALGGFSGGGLASVVPGHAEGGLIRGPGGPKTDSIPARLSDGEFVVQADAVKSFGAHNLEAINRGLKVPAFQSLALPKFAEGGLVGSSHAGPGDSNIHLGIGLEEGLVLKHLSSKQAGNIILQHLTNNPKAASKALSRSQ
jgi:hypothetical protein